MTERPSAIEIVLTTQHGLEYCTFDTSKTIVRTFGDHWSHMNYVAQMYEPEEKRPPRMLWIRGLGELLLNYGFVEVASPPFPTPFEQEMYVQYQTELLEAAEQRSGDD